MSVVQELMNKYENDEMSLDIQQCRVLIDYLLCERDIEQSEKKRILYENADLEFEVEMIRDELTQCKKENLDFADCWVHKDKLRELFKQVEISDYNSCVEFILAIKHLLKWEE